MSLLPHKRDENKTEGENEHKPPDDVRSSLVV